MNKIILAPLLFFVTLQLSAQYKNDNVLFTTVYPEDLANQLKVNPGYLLLDVRSPAESQDTASMAGMNIGHFKNSKNINVTELGSRLNELQSYKNIPVFVYCSHSQRSRRASKMLADSGFTKVFNINGGMSTLIQNNYGVNDMYETKNRFHFLSPARFCNEVNKKDVIVIDVRNDSSYNAISMDEETNAVGKFKNAIHIPFSNLENSLAQIPKDKIVIMADTYGDESLEAANFLTSKGYTNVYVLFDGMYNLITTSDVNCKNEIWQQNKKYHILTGDEFNVLANQNKDIAILDVRSSVEYNNKSTDLWRNIGHLKNAINIPNTDIATKWNAIASLKNKPVVIYNFTSNRDAYKAAAALVENGFTNVNILAGGLFNLRWKAANIKGKAPLKDWVTDIPDNNL